MRTRQACFVALLILLCLGLAETASADPGGVPNPSTLQPDLPSIDRATCVIDPSGECIVPTVSVSASPSQLTVGGVTTVSWVSSNSTSCEALGSWSGALSLSGSSSLSLTVAGTYTFIVRCYGEGTYDQMGAQVVVSDLPPPPPVRPTVSLSANPGFVDDGQSVRLSWASTNSPTSCSGNFGPTLPAAGFVDLFPHATATYTITCSNAAGTSDPASATVTVNVPPPTCTDGATFSAEQAPDVMPVSWTFNATVTMTNTGNCTWTSDPTSSTSYRLATSNGTIWGTSTVSLGSGIVAPGQSITFAIPSTAPVIAGYYGFQWRMTHGGFGFGQASTALSVHVISTADDTATLTRASSFSTLLQADGTRCNTDHNWSFGLNVVFTLTTRVDETTTWCFKKGAFACGKTACPFHRTVDHSQGFLWEFTDWNYGPCATNTCGDLTGRAWIGNKSPIDIWVKGSFKHCLSIPLVGSLFCNTRSERPGMKLSPTGTYVDTYG